MTPAVRLWLWRIGVWSLAVAPLALLGLDTLHGNLGANPIERLEHTLGIWSLRFLLLTLTMTPLRLLTGWPEPLQMRRTFGLWAYVYICLHFAVYIIFDLNILQPGHAAKQLAEDLVKRLYITVGFTAWLLLLPLAITSTKGWQRRLKRNWQKLHRLIYVAAVLGVLHFIWLVKKDESEPLTYAAILLLLLAWRWPGPQVKRAILRARTSQAPSRDQTFKPRP